MFLNLRGDASLCSRQTRLISSISSVVTVVVDIYVLADSSTIETMKSFYQNKAKVMLVLTNTSRSPDMSNVKTLLQSYINTIGKENFSATTIINTIKAGKQKTLTEIRHEIHQHLSGLLKEQPETSIQNISSLAETQDICIDETDPLCQEGRRLADEVTTHMNNMSITEVKQQMLPIQKDLWPQWSKLMKDQHRTTGKDRQNTSIKERERLRLEMAQVRQKQLEKCKNLSPMMKTFISTLCNIIDQSSTVQFYLQWLKLHLDNISRNHLPGLRQKYNKLWIEFNEAKSKKTGSKIALDELKEKVKNAEVQLAEASCGLEHLLREVGQLYEASKESNVVLSTNTQQAVDKLPVVAAKLILLGHPIEFMDGDASSVPLTWVKAILTSLATITGEKRVFVLSVLGIQSSGKSTLMNTMFGLRFAVSAGRCTRGVYIQLVEVDKSKTGLPFDYILIVDTEGLRAPELSQDKHEHDNELATLVIGLGDVVLLNIKGENVAEMKDVLQIAVHAFLRMKIVNEDINFQQTCIFIHQNVSAANAQEKMMHGRQNLLDNLDIMTKEAAELEGFKDIQTFRQIIELDVEKCVWYFSDLWRGDPPMAPANPGYSESVSGVKTCLLFDISKQKHEQQHTFLSMSHLKTRVEDLWKGILADDFVFSFRNSLAVKAYSGLDDKYHEVTWAIEQSIMKWSTEIASIKLERCETEDVLDDTTCHLLNELDGKVAELLDGQQKELEEYFQRNTLQEIVIQWKAEKIHSLLSFTEEVVTLTKKNIRQKKDILKFELRNRTKQEGLEQRIVAKASELADEVKGRSIEEHELQPKFNEMWVRWVAELAPPTPLCDTPSIYITVESILWDRMRSYSVALRQELERHPLNQTLKKKSLTGSFIVERKDIHETRGYMSKMASDLWEGGERWKKYHHQTQIIVEKVFQKVEVYLNDLTAKDTSFQQSYATAIIKMVTDGVDEHNRIDSERYKFTLPSTFLVRLAVHVCRHAVKVFTKMQGDYEKRHSPARKLEDIKTAAYNLFKNKVENCTNERVAADLFCDRLEELIKTKVKESMPRKIVDDVSSHFMKKYHLIVAILEELANKGIFEDYKSYLNDSKVHTLKWLTKFTNDKLFSSIGGEAQTLYAQMAQVQVKHILKGVDISVRNASNYIRGVEEREFFHWLKRFCDKIEDYLPVREAQMKPVTAQGVHDITNFENMLLDKDRFVLMERNILEDFRVGADAIKWTGTTPYQMILDKLWGCGEQCPFCNAPCQWMDPNHWDGSHKVSHQCIQHRPGGVGGSRWDSDTIFDGLQVKKDQLSNEACNYFVQCKDVLFSCRDCHYLCRKSGKCSATGENGFGVHHCWTEYKTWLPSWDIAPSPTNDNSKYWMWFLKTYQCQLKYLFDARLPHIPTSWEMISKEEAIRSLREAF